MSPFAFDTLSASKQLREAGMSEGVAEAVVSVFQHAAAMPDISHLATKEDLEASRLATKADIDIQRLATKAEIDNLRLEVKASEASIRADFNDKLRQQGWMLLGGVAVLLTISTAMSRVLAG